MKVAEKEKIAPVQAEDYRESIKRMADNMGKAKLARLYKLALYLYLNEK